MDADNLQKVKGQMHSFAMGEAMAQAARDYQKVRNLDHFRQVTRPHATPVGAFEAFSVSGTLLMRYCVHA